MFEYNEVLKPIYNPCTERKVLAMFSHKEFAVGEEEAEKDIKLSLFRRILQ